MTSRTRALWRCVWQLARPHGGALLGGFACMLVARACALVPAFAMRQFLDVVVGAHHYERLVPLALAVIGAAVLQGTAAFAQIYLLVRAGQAMMGALRCQMQSHVLRFPVHYFDGTKTGVIVSRIMTDVESIRVLAASGTIDLVGGVLTAIVAVVLMLRISMPLAVICIPSLIAFGFIARRALARLVPLFKHRSQVQADLVGRLTEAINGVRVIKVYRTEAAEERTFAGGIDRLRRATLRANLSSASIALSGMAILGVLGGLVLLVSGRGIAAQTLTVGDYVMFTSMLALFVSPVSAFIVQGTPLAEAVASLQRVTELLELPDEEKVAHRTRAIDELVGDVTFDDVSFAYQPDAPVLHDLTFHAPADSVTALVGPSGAGKSTLIGLLAAFASPTAGTIRVDGLDLSTLRLSSYRRHLAVVLQETFLFDGTIRENVALSRPEASEDQIIAACRVARVDDFARTLPDGYDTVVGERGVRLSGGQKQRVSIARAILSNPRILILDEATSSVDSVSEALIQEALTSLMKGRTTFVIAHRLSTIRRADQILVLDNGHIVERGTHESLLAAGSLYAQLCLTQYERERTAAARAPEPVGTAIVVPRPPTEGADLTAWSSPFPELYRPR